MTSAAVAQPPFDTNGTGWKVSAELGFIDLSGNTESTTINAKLYVAHESETWRNKLQAEHLQSFENEGVTAKRSVGQATTNYKLDERNYLFGNFRAEKDEIGGLDYRISETIGYGRRFLAETQKLDLEVGVGGSHTRFINQEQSNDAILRLATTYIWKISDTAELSEVAFSEIGENNTHSESETGLKVKINGSLATKLSYRVLHNTEPPAGTEDTDTVTAVTLVYDFS
ncbi:MAG: DUF481 domain-containing protein [Gammaproteobacteria bacterium]|nr:DUF481 domain-containing protein [Gammaproteobacteria bacterium]